MKVGDRVIVVDTDAAHQICADVRKGQTGRIERETDIDNDLIVLMDDGWSWYLPAKALALVCDQDKADKMKVPMVYKVLIEKEDGTLVSRTAGGKDWEECPELIYKEGQITYAPEGSLGIYTDSTLKVAHWTAKDRAGEKTGVMVIHEAVPLGEERPQGEGWSAIEGRYPAILLGKEVWREEPKEEWVDVTKRLEAQFLPAHTSLTGGTTVLLVHNNVPVARIGIGQPWVVDKDKYKIEVATHYYLGELSTFKVYEKVAR